MIEKVQRRDIYKVGITVLVERKAVSIVEVLRPKIVQTDKAVDVLKAAVDKTVVSVGAGVGVVPMILIEVTVLKMLLGSVVSEMRTPSAELAD